MGGEEADNRGECGDEGGTYEWINDGVKKMNLWCSNKGGEVSRNRWKKNLFKIYFILFKHSIYYFI